MHVLFIMDPLPSLKAYKDSSVAMMRALTARGHRISVALQADLYIEMGQVRARATPVSLVDGADLHEHAWWTQGQACEAALGDFGAVVMRKDPPFDMEYFYSAQLLAYAQQQGAKVFNAGHAICTHPEKLAITEFAQFTSPTLVSRDMARLRAFHAQHGDVVVKPLDGMGGMGIFRVGGDGMNLGSIIETLNQGGATSVMAQAYLPEIALGDKRLLLIGGQVAPYVLARIPQGSEVRGNLAAGGKGVAQPLQDADRAVAEAIAPVLAKRGLLLVGLDMIGNKVTEINVTSPTCFQEITDQTGFDVPAMFVDALEAALAA